MEAPSKFQLDLGQTRITRSRTLRVYRIGLLLSFGIGILFSVTRLAIGQARPGVTRISDAPTCSSCSIVLQPIAILGGRDGPGEIDRQPLAIREDGLGRFWLLPGANEMPRVYSGTGAYVGTVGTKGAGPGEFLGPAALMPIPGDSMLIVDLFAARATVVGADLKPRRTMIFPRDVEPELAIAWPRSVMLQGWIATPQQAGLQLHRTSLAGREPTFLQSYSPDSGQWRRQFDWPAVVRAVPAQSGFWSYNTYRYRFTQWSTDGTMIADYEREAAWFPRKDRVIPIGNTKTPPAPSLVRVIPGVEQRVWTIVNVPSPNWRRAWERVAKGSGDISVSSIAFENLYHSVVEEIDLKSARVLSRTPMEKWIIAAFEGGRVAAYEVDAQGVPRVVIYALVRRR